MKLALIATCKDDREYYMAENRLSKRPCSTYSRAKSSDKSVNTTKDKSIEQYYFTHKTVPQESPHKSAQGKL